MYFCIGDLVQNKEDLSLGIVVKRSSPVQGLEKSKHTQHILSSYAPVYYVYTVDGVCDGPYQKSELVLQQSYNLPINNMCDHP